jgi:Flp pilus assembly protein protease CpaA
MQDADVTRSRKRRSNRAVLSGLGTMAIALFVSAVDLAPPMSTTIAAVIGFVFLMYGLHLGWLVFYEREHDGPSS